MISDLPKQDQHGPSTEDCGSNATFFDPPSPILFGTPNSLLLQTLFSLLQ